MASQPIRVLHVCEALGGGVTTALVDFVKSTPDCEHHLLARKRFAHETGQELASHFRSVTELPKSFTAATKKVRELNEQLRPDVIHAHSSFAGAQVRLARGVEARRVVYTPHCYAFERQDTSWLMRSAFYVSESLMARRAHWVAACSPREVELSTRLGRGSQTIYVPNVARVFGEQAGFHEPMTVVTAGRITQQKDPDWFAEAARKSRAMGSPTRWVWLGGGDDGATKRLQSAGVEVTGWVTREEVLEGMSRASVYAHTALWEGAPVTLLEAAALGLPIIGRRIPALAALGVKELYNTPGELVLAAERLRQPGRWRAAAAQSKMLLAGHDVSMQAAALSELYHRAAGRPVVAEPTLHYSDFVASGVRAEPAPSEPAA